MECMQCQQPIRAGRRDRKFCTDKCKHEYHNAEKFVEHSEINTIVVRLKQNRRILKLILGGKDELYIGKELLQRHGFDFAYHTHLITSGQGNRFVLCFNYGYRVMEEGQLKVVHWKKD